MSILFSEVERILEHIPITFGGGCSLHKAHMMAWLIRHYKLRQTIDIGVYKGRSLFPQALAHARYTKGLVYGVDPWSATEAQEYDNPALQEAIDHFVKTTDFDAIYHEVEELRHSLSLDNYCTILRKTSMEAHSFFTEHGIYFDLIHIDANHDTERVMQDVALYLPRLKRHGFVVLDDISWKSVLPAYDLLRARLSLVYQRVGGGDDFAIFWWGSSVPATWIRRKLQNRVAAEPGAKRRLISPSRIRALLRRTSVWKW